MTLFPSSVTNGSIKMSPKWKLSRKPKFLKQFQFNGTGSAISNGREPKSCLDQVFNSKLGHIDILCNKCMVWHAATSRVENSAQGSSCQLKFVHGWDNFWNSSITFSSWFPTTAVLQNIVIVIHALRLKIVSRNGDKISIGFKTWVRQVKISISVWTVSRVQLKMSRNKDREFNKLFCKYPVGYLTHLATPP